MNAVSPLRVLLVHPPNPEELTYPLGLASLAAVASAAGASVVGVDLRIQSTRSLRATLRNHRFDYVGIGALSTTIGDAAAATGVIRELQPSAFVVVGGPHATLAPQDALQRTRADAAVRGDGEAPFAALLAGRLDGPGIMLRGSDSIPAIHVQDDLDALLPADRSVFPVARYYRGGVLGRDRRTSVVATRGCRLDCGYCSAKAASRGVFRTRSVDAVIDEIARLRLDHGVTAIVFEDDNLMLDPAWHRALFEALACAALGMQVDLPNGVHPALIDEPTIDLMRRAGVRSLAFGVESALAAERESIGRTFDLGHLERVCRRARSAGIITTGYVLIGLPEQSVRSALSQVVRLRSLPFDMLHVSAFLDLPGQRVRGIHRDSELRRWRRVRRAMYAAWYAQPGRALRVLTLAGGDARAMARLAGRAIAWWR